MNEMYRARDSEAGEEKDSPARKCDLLQILMNTVRSSQCAVKSEKAISDQKRSRHNCARLKGKAGGQL